MIIFWELLAIIQMMMVIVVDMMLIIRTEAMMSRLSRTLGSTGQAFYVEEW